MIAAKINGGSTYVNVHFGMDLGVHVSGESIMGRLQSTWTRNAATIENGDWTILRYALKCFFRLNLK